MEAPSSHMRSCIDACRLAASVTIRNHMQNNSTERDNSNEYLSIHNMIQDNTN